MQGSGEARLKPSLLLQCWDVWFGVNFDLCVRLEGCVKRSLWKHWYCKITEVTCGGTCFSYNLYFE